MTGATLSVADPAAIDMRDVAAALELVRATMARVHGAARARARGRPATAPRRARRRDWRAPAATRGDPPADVPPPPSIATGGAS